MFGLTELKFNKIEGPIDPNYTETWKQRWLSDLHGAFGEHGQVPPTLAFLADDPEDPSGIIDALMDLAPFLQNDDTKNIMETVVPSLLQKLNAFALIQICEAWTIPAEKMHEYYGGDYSNMGEFPGAREIVLFSMQTHRGGSLMCFEIDRSEEKPQLVDTNVPQEFQQMEGRMANWLGKKKDREMN